MFIKVTLISDGKQIMINTKSITMIFVEPKANETFIRLGKQDLSVRETPEEIEALIEEAHRANLYRGFGDAT